MYAKILSGWILFDVCFLQSNKVWMQMNIQYSKSFDVVSERYKWMPLITTNNNILDSLHFYVEKDQKISTFLLPSTGNLSARFAYAIQQWDCPDNENGKVDFDLE